MMLHATTVVRSANMSSLEAANSHPRAHRGAVGEVLEDGDDREPDEGACPQPDGGGNARRPAFRQLETIDGVEGFAVVTPPLGCRFRDDYAERGGDVRTGDVEPADLVQ